MKINNYSFLFLMDCLKYYEITIHNARLHKVILVKISFLAFLKKLYHSNNASMKFICIIRLMYTIIIKYI